MSQPKRLKSKLKAKKNSVKKASGVSLKLVKSHVSEENLEVADEEEMANLGDTPDINDPNFQSELKYDGYQSIEEYDNDIFNGDVERKKNSRDDLKIDDREDDLDTGEESLVDPQENKK